MESLLLLTDETTKAFNIDEEKGTYNEADIQTLQPEDVYKTSFYRQSTTYC